MDLSSQKTIQVSRGLTYAYFVIEGDRSLPPLFFQHGWPDHGIMWRGVVTHLQALGVKHPMIIPDMLGFGNTSKPTDPAAYKWDVMMKDLVDIIDAEGYQKVISLGHDWGAGSAARLYNFYPDRVAGMILLNVAYLAPMRDGFDLDTVNNITEQAFGYPIYIYWHFFTAPDAPEVLKANLDRLYTMLHADGPDGMKDFFCRPDGIRSYLEKGDREVKVRPYAENPKLRQGFIDRLSKDGFEGAQCWYIATKDNYQTQCDKELPEGRDKVDVPVLYIGSKYDAVCRPEAMAQSKQLGWLPDLEETPMIDAAHWSPFERPQDIAKYMADWLQRKY